MTTTAHRYQSDFARRYYAQGEAQGEARGEARSVLAVLGTRGIDVRADIRERITSCAGPDQLESWVRRAVTARTAQDLFTDEGPSGEAGSAPPSTRGSAV